MKIIVPFFIFPLFMIKAVMKKIRSIVRKVILEKASIDGSKNVYATSDKGVFPYGENAQRIMPSEIDPVGDYVWDWKQFSENQDLYEFPINEFNLGLQIEKQRNSDLNILEVADKVLKNMKMDVRFYSKIREQRFQNKNVK